MNVAQSKGIRFNPEVSMGHVLQAVTIVAGLVFGYATMVTRIDALEVFKREQSAVNDRIVDELKSIGKDISLMREDQAVIRTRVEERFRERRERREGQ